jgi:hypothetical protein
VKYMLADYGAVKYMLADYVANTRGDIGGPGELRAIEDPAAERGRGLLVARALAARALAARALAARTGACAAGAGRLVRAGIAWDARARRRHCPRPRARWLARPPPGQRSVRPRAGGR